MATSRAAPRITSIIPPGGGRTSVKDRFPVSRVTFTPAQFKKHDGSMDFEELSRQLNSSAESLRSATNAARSNPLGNGVIVQQVTLINGTQKVITHGLGAPYGYYYVVRVYPTFKDPANNNRITQGAFPAYFESPQTTTLVNGGAVTLLGWPAGTSPDQHLVLMPQASGTYDFYICPL